MNEQLKAIKKAGYKLYQVCCGDADFAYPGTLVLEELLKRNGLEHTLVRSFCYVQTGRMAGAKK